MRGWSYPFFQATTTCTSDEGSLLSKASLAWRRAGAGHGVIIERNERRGAGAKSVEEGKQRLGKKEDVNRRLRNKIDGGRE